MKTETNTGEREYSSKTSETKKSKEHYSKASEQIANEEEFTTTDTKNVIFEQIEGTPFIAVLLNEKWRISIGFNVLSDWEFETFEDAKHHVEQKSWDLILNTAIFIMTKIKEQE